MRSNIAVAIPSKSPTRPISPLIKEIIDTLIVPLMVKKYLAEHSAADVSSGLEICVDNRDGRT
jgi:hypothetical protein